MAEYSRQQLTRLIQQYTQTGRINWTPCRSNGVSKKYTDQDKVKGAYHINAADEVTQLEIVCSVGKTSEHYLMPALEQLLNIPTNVSLNYWKTVHLIYQITIKTL